MDTAILFPYLAYALCGFGAALMLIVAFVGSRAKKKSLCILATAVTGLVILGHHFKQQPSINVGGFKSSIADLKIENLGLMTKTQKLEAATVSLSKQLHEKNISELLCRSELSEAQGEITTLSETVSSLRPVIDETTRQLAKKSSRVQNLSSRIDLALARADASLQRMNKLVRDSEISKQKYDRRLPGSTDAHLFAVTLAAGHTNLAAALSEVEFITTVLRTGEIPKSKNNH